MEVQVWQQKLKFFYDFPFDLIIAGYQLYLLRKAIKRQQVEAKAALPHKLFIIRRLRQKFFD